MTKKMLIDATHEEETRVAIVDGHRLAEFDYESKYRKPLKGSIFLAKVTRVEPSLQAAFVNFGGNRHGFLPFSEIHPDYFRIPIADREALMAEQEAYLRQHEEEEKRAAAAGEEPQHAQDSEEGVVSVDGEGNVESVEDQFDDAIEEVGGGEMTTAPSEQAPEQMNDADGVHDDFAAGEMIAEHSEELPEENYGNALHEEFDVIDEVSGNVLPQEGEFNEIEDSIGNNEESNRSANDLAEGAPQQRGGRNNRGRGGRGGGERNDRGGERGGRGRGRGGRGGRNGGGRGRPMEQRSNNNRVEMVGGEDFDDGDRKFRFNLRRQYKIQEVVKRGQIMLIQVSKEERGNKGAAVTSYLSLPGRYCVLMPNSPRAGGVSRKIANHQDRARMREMLDKFNIPKGMSVIVRTAGVARAEEEIKRDLDYLMRLWDNIRELTLQSSAPAMIYEEADLIKRAVRDLYGRDVEEIHVSGTVGFQTAKNFMKMLMPSDIKKVIEYKDEKIPLFTRYQIEGQINEIGESTVVLRSGGYLVINPTEALVSIDVNSGKATKERHIEETALKTNLEAADEVARQLRLRDLGGLVVVDFIDMEDRRNNAKVERRLKEALSSDRARIQVGRISSFGLLELSRQRLNPSLTEAQYEKCTNCHGQGVVRTPDATSVMVMRSLEEEGIKGRAAQLIAHVSGKVALYILNHKRKHLEDIEKRYGFTVLIRVDDTMGASSFRIEVARPMAQSGDEDEEPPQRTFTSHDHVHENDDMSEYEDDEESEPSEGGDEPAAERSSAPRRERSSEGRSTEPRSQEARGEDGKGADGARRRGRRGGRRRGGRGRTGEARPDNRGPREGQGSEQGNEGGENNAAPSFSEPQDFQPAPEPREAAPQRATAAAANDAPKPVKPARREAPAPKSSAEYETVSEASGEKKRGWWNKITE